MAAANVRPTGHWQPPPGRCIFLFSIVRSTRPTVTERRRTQPRHNTKPSIASYSGRPSLS